MQNDKKIIKGYIRWDDINEEMLKTSKSGKRYLNIVLLPANSQYGDDYMLVTDTPKGEKGIILGNMRYLEERAASKEDQTRNNFKMEL